MKASRQRASRAEDVLKGAERDDCELVLRLAERGAALGADAHHAEMHPLDLNHLVDWIDVAAEQPIGRAPAEHAHRARRVDFHRAHQPSALGVEVRKVDVFAGHAGDPRAVDRLVAVGDPRARVGFEHDRRGQRAVAADRAHVLHRDARVAPHLLELFVAADDRELLNVE